MARRYSRKRRSKRSQRRLERRRRRILAALGGVTIILILYVGSRYLPGSQPVLPTARPQALWPTPPVADAFDYPLLPPENYAAYIQGVTGSQAVDTRFGVQNPALGNRSNCFRDVQGNPVPFSALYHAGVDLFGIDEAGQIVGDQAAYAPVHAVAGGVVVFVQDAGADGYIIIIKHRVIDGSTVYSVYWHVDQIQVGPGELVTRGQALAVVSYRLMNSHLHWEMRTFEDGSAMFPEGTAGARGTCNGRFAGVGYTWDDNPAYAYPGYYGYLDPIAFVQTH